MKHSFISSSSILKSTSVFIITATVCLVMLLTISLIPQSAINKGVRSSSDFFDSHDLFATVIDGQFNTRQDNYADCILVNIMYNVGQKDGQSLFASLMEDSYYHEENTNVNVGLRASVDSDVEANTEYSRYWHGSMVLLRPLFTFTDINGARLILGIIMHLLVISGVFLLWKRGYHSYSVIYLIGMVLINSWMLCCCIEYVTTFLVMGVVNIAVIILHNKKAVADESRHGKQLMLLMIISGVVTCFLDFLTTETITFTLPLLTELVMSRSDHKNTSTERFPEKKTYIQYFQYIVAWGISYAGMFGLKWILSYIVLGKQSLDSTLSQAQERISGTVYLGNTNLDPTADVGQRLSGALNHNMSMFFPFRNDANTAAGAVFFLILVVITMSIVYLFRSKQFNPAMTGLMLLLGLVPYVRYLLLSNHAYMHYFFTYRAQLVTVMVLMYICWEYGLENVVSSKHRKARR